MTSMIVFMLAIAVTIMGLYSFYKTGEVLDIFNTLVSAFVGAYLQRSIGNKAEPIKIEEEKPLPLMDDSGV